MIDSDHHAMIAVDAGGPFAKPAAEGAIAATKTANPPTIVLVGKTEELDPLIQGFETYITTSDAPEFLEDGFDYSRACHHRNSSLYCTAERVKTNFVDACISFSDTACVTAIYSSRLGRIDNIRRPGTATIWPGEKPTIMMDSGAVVDCQPGDLLQFARLGSILSETMLEMKNPKVGLLSIGEEESKGNQLTKSAFKLLANSEINFSGNCEGYALLNGDFDVIVTDGFTGNVALKASEGVMQYIKSLFAQYPELAKPAAPFLQILQQDLNPSEHGGAIFLGAKSLGMIGHGKSDALAFQKAIEAMKDYLLSGLLEKINQDIPKLSLPR